MTQNISITLSTKRIRASAGEKVSLCALFDQPVYVTIFEVGNEKGWQCLKRFDQKMRILDYEATVHSDTRLFDIVTNPDELADIDDHQHSVEVAIEVDVTDDPQPQPEPTPEPTPTPTPDPEPAPQNLGAYQFKYLALGDTHIDEDNDDHSPGDTNDDWWDEQDFKAAMDIAASDTEILFVENVGDIIESGSPAEATPDKDYQVFFDLYNVQYWQVAGLRFFTPMGNHGYYGMFETRAGDKVMGAPFTNETSINGYNDSVRDRICRLGIGGQGINGIVPGRGRIVFDRDDGQVPTSGQGDMQFFSYNGYIEMYAEAAGYTQSLTPTENRFSEEAIKTMNDYVLTHWDECRDNLTSWRDGYVGMRNAYSKLSFWMRKGNTIFINLSLDYGDDVWPINSEWHDRMIHARTLLNLDPRDPYVKRMLEYVEDTPYCESDEPYNYRYYSPNSLIWLKEIIDWNPDKNIHVYMHHYLPHRVGNDAGGKSLNPLPKDGGWSYAAINPAGVKTAEGLNAGSNCLTGIEFWFLNKLFNERRNVVCFSGHSHISYENSYHADNHDYPIVYPSQGGDFIYTKMARTPYQTEGAWLVSLPSLSKPRFIDDGSSSRLYEDAEATIVEVYEHGLKIKGYKIRKNNQDCYDPDSPLFEKTIILT